MNAILTDDGLAAAWREAEAALPDGYGVAVVPWLDDRADDRGGHPEWRYHAYPAKVGTIRRRGEQVDRPAPGMMHVWTRDGYGETPAAALRALAEALR